MFSPRQLVAGIQVRRPAIAVPRLSEGAVFALGGFVFYLVVAFVLVFGFHHVIGDAWSRITNAYYVLYSRDPHLAAIGFIWNPLPSLMAIPLLPLKAIFPPLTQLGFIANIYGAAFMAGALYMVWGILFDLGVRRWMRLTIVIVFALHPMIVQYGANGMTEAPFIFLSLATIRYLARWLMTGDLVPLVYAGVFLAVGYLVRYEAIAVGAATTLLVIGVAFLRAPGTLRFKAKTALADAIVFAAPLALIFVVWAGISWLIVGSAFEQFGSVYGTTSQLAADAENILYRETTGQVSLGFVIGHLLIMEPFVPVIAALAVALAVWRREVRVLVMLAVMGAVLAFEVWAFLTGKTGGWVRYYIVIIPLTVLLAGSILGRRADPPSWASLSLLQARLAERWVHAASSLVAAGPLRAIPAAGDRCHGRRARRHAPGRGAVDHRCHAVRPVRDRQGAPEWRRPHRRVRGHRSHDRSHEPARQQRPRRRVPVVRDHRQL